MVKGYKKTEIGLLPQNWEVKTIGKISTPKARIGWQNLRKEEYMESGLYMLITGTDFEDGRVNYSTCKFVSENRYEQDPNIQVKNGDVLVTKDGTLGKVAIIKGLNFKATLNAGVFVLGNLSSSINNEFLYQYLSTNRLMKYAERTSTGGTIQHLNQGVLVDFPIPVPPVEEQARMAAALSDIDDLIIKSEELIKKYQTMKQGCLQHMFPRNGQTEPDMRLPGFSGAWEQRKVGDICSISTGKSNTQDKVDDGIYPFYVRSPIIEHSNKYLYDEEAVLTVGDGVGTGKVFHYVNGKYDLHQRVYRMFGFSEDVSAKYFYQWFSEKFYDRVMAMTAKTSVDSVRYEMIADMEVQLPTIVEQNEIADFLFGLDHLITLHQRKREKYKMIKQGMMEDLLTGKVRLK